MVGQSAEMSLDVRGRPSGRPSEGASVRAWSTTSRLPRIAGTVGWSGPSAASPIASARSYCSPAPSRHDRRSGWTLPPWTAGHPLGHPPGPPSKMDTLLGLLDGASGHQDGRPPRPTPWPDARPLVVCSRPSLRVGRGARMTNDPVRLCGRPRRPSARVSALGGGPRPGIRVGVQPSRAGASIPTAMVRVMVKRLARQSPSRPCERPAWPHDVIRTGS